MVRAVAEIGGQSAPAGRAVGEIGCQLAPAVKAVGEIGGLLAPAAAFSLSALSLWLRLWLQPLLWGKELLVC